MLGLLANSGIVAFLQNQGVFILIAACFAIVYFIYIRPQTQKQRELEQWISNIAKGDEVITSGGLFGKVHEAEKGNPYIVLELQDKVRVKLLRSYVAGKPPEVKSSAKDDKKEEKK